jgi:DNA polymerase/3'-5' exonuclease PolX
MKLEQALEIAERIKSDLAPHCERIEIAGSIRRRKPEVGDIEIVCMPRQSFDSDLFGSGRPFRDGGFIHACGQIGRIRKGCLRTGKYMQFGTNEGIDVDLFTARPENWGLIYALRTGSAEFSHRVLASGWSRRGYISKDGMLTQRGEPVPVLSERELFDLAGVKWVEPELRT